MVSPMYRHPEIMKDTGQHDDDFGMLLGQLKIFDDTHRDMVFLKYPHEPQGDIGNNLKVHRSVITHPQAVDGVDVQDIPKRQNFLVLIYAREDGGKKRISLQRDMDRRFGAVVGHIYRLPIPCPDIERRRAVHHYIVQQRSIDRSNHGIRVGIPFPAFPEIRVRAVQEVKSEGAI